MDSAQAALDIRRTILRMARQSGGPHVGSSLSCADILAVLYFRVMNLEPWEQRDIFILSKAHAAMCLYSALATRGIIDDELLDGYYQDNGTLPAHLDRTTARGVEASGGSLGHGFNMGLGMAYQFKRTGSDRKVFVVVGDGESQEGSIWEGALFAPALGLDNFTMVLDYNNLQGYGRARELCSYEPIADKWSSFGWDVWCCDGHDHEALEAAITAESTGKPRVVIADTTKGKGVSFMEDELVWHYYVVTEEIYQRALKEL